MLEALTHRCLLSNWGPKTRDVRLLDASRATRFANDISIANDISNDAPHQHHSPLWCYLGNVFRQLCTKGKSISLEDPLGRGRNAVRVSSWRAQSLIFPLYALSMSSADYTHTTTAPDGSKVTTRDERAAQSTSSRDEHAEQEFCPEKISSPSSILFPSGRPYPGTAPGDFLRGVRYDGWTPDSKDVEWSDPVLDRFQKYQATQLQPAPHAVSETSTGFTSQVYQTQTQTQTRDSGGEDDSERQQHKRARVRESQHDDTSSISAAQ